MQTSPRSFQKFKKTPMIISTLFLVLACAAFFLAWKGISDNQDASKILETEWQNEAARREEISSLQHSVNAIAGERTMLESHFAQSSDVVPFLDTIGSLAASAGVKSEMLSVEITKDKSGLVVGVEATGSFDSTYKFLTLLENSPYEISFDKFDMRKVTGQWDTVFNIKLLSFISQS